MDIQNVKPQYPFEKPDEDVTLAHEEPATILIQNKEYAGKGDAVLHLGRKPRIKFTMTLDDDAAPACIELNGKARLTLSDRDIYVEEGHCNYSSVLGAVVSGQNQQPTMSWAALREPFIVLGDESTEINAFVFHLLNCPKLSRPNNKEAIGQNGWSAISIITLKWKGWVIEFKSTADLRETIKQVGANGGFGLTHVGIIRKADNSAFKIKDTSLLRSGFSCFMDFVVGRLCQPCFCVGFNDGNMVYEDWGANFSTWSRPETWGTGRADHWEASGTLEVLFPLFMDSFDIESIQVALWESVCWYRSTTEPGCPLIDQMLILLQAGIERLSYEYCVNTRRLIHKTGFKKLRASDRFRMLFSSFGIPLEIPDELSCLKDLALKLNWEDVPHSLTEIRNAMVHPEYTQKEQITDVYYDAWRVAIEYFELSMLAFCGYSGQYFSRMKEKHISVPWKKDCSS